MIRANDIKIDIISMISDLTDVEKLKSIRSSIIKSIVESTEEVDIWKGASTEIEKGVSFEDLVKQQNYKPISFSEFTSIIDQGEWETPLDELLSYSN